MRNNLLLVFLKHFVIQTIMYQYGLLLTKKNIIIIMIIMIIIIR